MLVRMTITLHGSIEQEMTKEEWLELDERLKADERVNIGDGIDIENWSDAVNQLDGEIEEASIVRDPNKLARSEVRR